ncbi:unnamed protein product [Danaus chrysippus]|uniref:(African queen) hypothetical protein n=1 Tax=Danaus chrysippus TaxID=151541 RepID=A0A8J2RHU7_9NEOP|nr:unnamed protein product [Danaus chrysippus]
MERHANNTSEKLQAETITASFPNVAPENYDSENDQAEFSPNCDTPCPITGPTPCPSLYSPWHVHELGPLDLYTKNIVVFHSDPSFQPVCHIL